MIVPAAMNIESARDMLKDVPGAIREDQRKELHDALGETSPEFQNGYDLGLQTARAILLGSPALVLKGIDPRQVL